MLIGIPTVDAATAAKIDNDPDNINRMLPIWNAAKARMLSGVENARILGVGDSTMFGYGAAGATFAGNLKDKAYLSELVKRNTGYSYQSTFGNNDAASINRFPGADTRVNPGSWVISGGSKIGIGQYPYLATAAATYAFTPTTQFDTIEIFYLSDPTFGTYTVNVDGGASLGTINCAQATAFRKQTYTVALGLHTTNCVWATGNAYIGGIVVYNSAVKEVSVINAGAAGAKIADYASPPSMALAYSPLNSLPVVLPHLILVGFTINDTQSLTNLDTYGNNLQKAINAGKGINADHLFITGVPGDRATRQPQAVQQLYINKFKSVAAANNIPVLDMFNVFGNYATANARGLMIDAVHFNYSGHLLYQNYRNKVL